MSQFMPGALFRIPVEDDHAYALMLSKSGYVAFYGKDVEFDDEGAPAGPPLFTVLVTDPTYSGRKWGKPIRMVSGDELPRIPKFFRQTATGADLRIVDPEAGRVASARREDLEGLEQEGAWTADHIKSRILDAYAGRPNRFAESLKPRL
jgi:hypothetical protein